MPQKKITADPLKEESKPQDIEIGSFLMENQEHQIPYGEENANLPEEEDPSFLKIYFKKKK